jgi:S-adenosylmethionine/arginine decarboxylase-like enzyme
MKAQMFNKAQWVSTTDPTVLREYYTNALELAGFTILKFVDYKFTPYGYTALWLLGESHLAIHTFPEEHKSYVELTSCVEEPYNNFIKILEG